jgi:N-acetylmuramoyl-L-alanine amidase
MERWFGKICILVAVVFTVAVGLCVRVLFSPKTVAAVEEAICIVLDAGHGGIDGGVMGKETKAKESDINLAITYELKSALETLGFKTILTRKTEAGLYGAATKGFKKRDMQKRREIIEEADPAMVISLHQNFYPTRNTRGAQVFYSKENASGQRLAVELQRGLNTLYAKEGARGRNAASAEFYMLECSDCPSVLIECGFLSNHEDERLLTSADWQKRLAGVIAEGVMAYFFDLTA